MNLSAVTPIYSIYFQDLKSVFNSLQKPYGPSEIARFNFSYQNAHHHLNRLEKRRAEEFVDALLADLANDELASTIFGVV